MILISQQTPVKKTHSAHVWIRCGGPTALTVFCHVAWFVIHLQTLIWNRSDIDDHKRICEFYSEVVRWICVRKQPHVMMGLDTGPVGRRKIALVYFAEKRLSFWPHHLFQRFIQSIRMKTPTQWKNIQSKTSMNARNCFIKVFCLTFRITQTAAQRGVNIIIINLPSESLWVD